MMLDLADIKEGLLLKKGNPQATEQLQENMRSLNRWMRFWAGVKTDAASAFVKGMVAVAMAIAGYGVHGWVQAKQLEAEKLRNATISNPSSVTIEVAPGEKP